MKWMRGMVPRAKSGAPYLGAWCYRTGGDQRDLLAPGHHKVHLAQELALARPLGLAFESALTVVHLLHDVTSCYWAISNAVLQAFPE